MVCSPCTHVKLLLHTHTLRCYELVIGICYFCVSGTVKGEYFDVHFHSDNNLSGNGFYATYAIQDSPPAGSAPQEAPVGTGKMKGPADFSVSLLFLSACYSFFLSL